MAAEPGAEDFQVGAKYGRVPIIPQPRDPEERRRRRWKAASVTAILCLSVLVVLSALPLESTVRVSETQQFFSVSAAREGNTQQISDNFNGICDRPSVWSNLVGNQTFWITWSSNQSGATGSVRLVAFAVIPFQVYFNDTNLSAGGFSRSSATALSWMCSLGLAFLAQSDSGVTLALQVGILYNLRENTTIL